MGTAKMKASSQCIRYLFLPFSQFPFLFFRIWGSPQSPCSKSPHRWSLAARQVPRLLIYAEKTQSALEQEACQKGSRSRATFCSRCHLRAKDSGSAMCDVQIFSRLEKPT